MPKKSWGKKCPDLSPRRRRRRRRRRFESRAVDVSSGRRHLLNFLWKKICCKTVIWSTRYEPTPPSPTAVLRGARISFSFITMSSLLKSRPILFVLARFAKIAVFKGAERADQIKMRLVIFGPGFEPRPPKLIHSTYSTSLLMIFGCRTTGMWLAQAFYTLRTLVLLMSLVVKAHLVYVSAEGRSIQI